MSKLINLGAVSEETKTAPTGRDPDEGQPNVSCGNHIFAYRKTEVTSGDTFTVCSNPQTGENVFIP